MALKLRSLLDHLRQDGLGATARLARHELSEQWHERRLGISTAGISRLADLGIEQRDSIDYMPSSYRSVARVLAQLREDERRGLFIDYGSGKGRVLAMASQQGFSGVVGIELVVSLAAAARENLARMRPPPGCPVHVEVANVVDYVLPADARVLHFYNPFRNATLSRVMDRIEDSLRGTPRPLTILFANPDDFDRQVRERHWPVTSEDVPWPGFPRPDELSNIYRIYRLAAGAVR